MPPRDLVVLGVGSDLALEIDIVTLLNLFSIQGAA